MIRNVATLLLLVVTCCTCGGRAEPAQAPLVCHDVLIDGQEWQDDDGFSCSEYVINTENNDCEEYGDLYENDGYTANTACCVCGGGGTTPQPEAPAPSCHDVLIDGRQWNASDNISCFGYIVDNEIDDCTEYGDLYAKDGHTGNTACCVCGGGVTAPQIATPQPETPAPPSCYDVLIDGQQWHDAESYPCSEYVMDIETNHCEDYGDLYEN
ncbi:hypothetical protein DIPPA_56149, partial [Diplonema papillatum]